LAEYLSHMSYNGIYAFLFRYAYNVLVGIYEVTLTKWRVRSAIGSPLPGNSSAVGEGTNFAVGVSVVTSFLRNPKRSNFFP